MAGADILDIRKGVIHKEPAAIDVGRRMYYNRGRFVWNKSRRK